MDSGDPRVGAVLLAAGASSRMRGGNKLLEEIGGVPVVAGVVDQITAAGATPVVVVVGHEARRLADSLADRSVTLVQNPLWMDGLSTSLAAGLAALDGRVDGALVCLGDMPRVKASDIAGLIGAFREAWARDLARTGAGGPAAWVPVNQGRRGNPVLWTAAWFPELRALQGDRGARGLLTELGERVVEVPAGGGVLFDVDTPGELEKARGNEG